MAGTAEGAIKVAAKRVGLSEAEYRERFAAGLKWCIKCRSWKSQDEFCKDASRWDGRASACSACRYQRTTPGPGRAERQQHRLAGEAWCNGCRAWLPAEEVHAGRCRSHKNAYDRQHYRTDGEYRARRQRRSALHKQRGTVPQIGKDVLTDDFAGRCAYCSATADTFDHIVPLSKGGRTTPGNVVPACKPCNSSKGDRDLDEWLRATGRVPSEELEERRVLADAGLHG